MQVDLKEAPAILLSNLPLSGRNHLYNSTVGFIDMK
jgi:hypothetical protein